MGRLDDIIARNKHANARVGGGLIGAAIHAAQDPTDTVADRKSKMLAMTIVGGVIAVIVVLVAVLA